MNTFEPLINLLVLLSVLSIAAERVMNVFKLRRSELRESQTDLVALDEKATDEEKQKALKQEKEREGVIAQGTLLVSIALAILVKADFFEILTHVDAPWDTLGWVRVSGAQWVRSTATTGISQFFYALGGCAITGIGMGFGSKFWHDMLDIVYNARENLKQATKRDKNGA